MRPIKFRAYDKEKKVMIYDQDQKTAEVYDLLIGSYMPTTVRRIGEFYNTYMQFTGLHDRNGKAIYEGDIVRYFIKLSHLNSSYKDDHIVKFKNGRFGVLPIHPELCHPDDRKFRSLFLIKQEDLDIVGSIHENPELLETK